MSEVEASEARRIADEILACRTSKARGRELDRHRADFSEHLAREFRRRAATRMRKTPQEAREVAVLAEQVAAGASDPEALLLAIHTQARAAVLGGQHREALALLERGRSLTRHADVDTSARLEVDALRIQILIQLDRHAEAREVARRVLDAAETRGDATLALRAHLAMAELATRQDRPREALRHFRRIDSLPLPRMSPRAEAVIAGNRANALMQANRLRAAARQHQRARTLFAAEGCDHTVAQVDYNAAWVDTLLGRFRDALAKLARAEQVFERQGDERHLAQVSLDRADVYLRMHHVEDALHFARQARDRFEALDILKERGQALVLCARAAAQQGEGAEALRAWRAASVLFARLDLAVREVDALTQAARIALAEGRARLARRLLDRARRRGADEGVGPLAQAGLDLVAARLALVAPVPDPAGAEALTAGVRGLLRRVHAPALEIEAWHLTGRARSLSGEGDGAIDAFRRAVDLLERFREGVPPDEYMTQFLGAHAGLYEDIVDALLEAGVVELAFEYCERAKSRSLWDLLDRSPSDLRPTRRRARYLRERLHGMYRSLGHLSAERAQASGVARRMRGETQDYERELARVLRQLQIVPGRPPAVHARRRDPRDRRERREIRSALGEDTVLLEYFLTETWLAVFVITKDGVAAYRRPVDRADLRLRIERFHFHLSQYQRPYAPVGGLALAACRANLESLASLLLEPIAPHLRRRIVVVPHGDLHHVPFHALPRGAGWLADAFEIRYAPSAAIYVACGRPVEDGRSGRYVFGLPDAGTPLIEEEARAVAAHLGGARLFLGPDASWENLEQIAPHALAVHIATHGMYRHATPSVSCIRLADGWVTPQDLYDLRLDGALVVLSACEGRTADARAGDEAQGITRGFLAAGARALLTAQWCVRDDVTARFMDAFYARLAAAGDVAAAYAGAMQTLRTTHPHPYHWAPFFLTGQPQPIPTARPASEDAALAAVPCTSSPRGYER